MGIVVGGHAYEPSFECMFEEAEGFNCTVLPHPMAYKRTLRAFDILVLYDMLDELEPEKREILKAFVESGKGIVSLHHAIVDYGDWAWWSQEVIGGRYILPKDGKPVSVYKDNVDMVVRPVGNHPIIRGLKEFPLRDEAYKKMWISPAVQVLLETDHPDNDRAVAWVSPYPKSKVAYIQLGHGRSTHRDPRYRQLVRNAMLWAAGRLV